MSDQTREIRAAAETVPLQLSGQGRSPLLRRVFAPKDVFWPVFAVGMTVLVVFVASVAYASMNGVGSPATVTEARQLPRLASAVQTFSIVQVSSQKGEAGARKKAKALVGKGYQALVLHSDDYTPMNPGYYVVYIGPYPATADGHREARRVQEKLPSALIRDVSLR